MGHVVWHAEQKKQRVREFARVAKAVHYHYMRCLFGAQYGMVK